MKVEDRLLKYVSYWTTSDESNTNIPSSDREFSLPKGTENSPPPENGIVHETINSSKETSKTEP